MGGQVFLFPWPRWVPIHYNLEKVELNGKEQRMEGLVKHVVRWVLYSQMARQKLKQKIKQLSSVTPSSRFPLQQLVRHCRQVSGNDARIDAVITISRRYPPCKVIMIIPTNKIAWMERRLLVKGKAEVKMQQDNSYLMILLSPVVSIVLRAGQDNLHTWVCLQTFLALLSRVQLCSVIAAYSYCICLC